MRMTMKVTYQDGAGADVVVSAPDFVAFEREFDRSVARFESEIRFTDICWLAWHKLNRDKQAGDFDVWLNTLEQVSITDAEEPVPLDKTALTST